MPPSAEQYAQLAALFTTSDAPADQSAIELLLPAHLPVQGSLWLVPYAGRVAENGLSMLIRMHEDCIDVAAVGQGTIDLTTCTSIEDVIGQLDSPVTHWIIQPPSDADPTSLLHCDADYVTLLSGADQAAVVGAYRLLKGLITAMSDSEELPPIRLVIVGAEERSSSDAASRIIQTAHHQLGVTIEVGEPLPAMGSGCQVISQVTFKRTSNVVDFMSRLRNIEAQDSPQDELPITHRFDGLQDVTVDDDCTVKVSEQTMSAIDEESGTREHRSQETTDNLPQYAAYVEGLLAISPRCPEHEHVELAVDGDGCLHILADACDFRDAAIVAGWSIRHHSILSMACGGLQLDASVPPVQHLFTNDAVSVADLQGSGIRLHLLAEVTVEGNTGIFSTPLNK